MLLLSAYTAAGCGGPKCANEAFFGLPSPDGTAIAFVFHRRCIGKVEVSTDVTVLDFHNSLRNEPGNVLSVRNEQPVRVAWLGANRLLVSGFKEPIQIQQPQAGSVTIEFRSNREP